MYRFVKITLIHYQICFCYRLPQVITQFLLRSLKENTSGLLTKYYKRLIFLFFLKRKLIHHQALLNKNVNELFLTHACTKFPIFFPPHYFFSRFLFKVLYYATNWFFFISPESRNVKATKQINIGEEKTSTARHLFLSLSLSALMFIVILRAIVCSLHLTMLLVSRTLSSFAFSLRADVFN